MVFEKMTMMMMKRRVELWRCGSSLLRLSTWPEPQSGVQRLVVTALGPDRRGIVAGLSKRVLDCGGSFEISRMSRLAGEFSTRMLVTFDITKAEQLRSSLPQIEGPQVNTRWTFDDQARPVRKFQKIPLRGVDSPGLFRNRTEYLSSRGINIESLETRTQAASPGNDKYFIMEGVIAMPVGLSAATFIHNLDTLQATLCAESSVSDLQKIQQPSQMYWRDGARVSTLGAFQPPDLNQTARMAAGDSSVPMGGLDEKNYHSRGRDILVVPHVLTSGMWSLSICHQVALFTMRGKKLLVLLLHAVTAVVALPDYPCAENFTTRGENRHLDPCVNTSAFLVLRTCQDFVENKTALPSAECCASVHDVWLQFPACFCRVTFFEHGFGGGSQPRFRARPLQCNLTADLCNLCPAYLYPHQSEVRSHKKRVAALVTIIIGAALTLVVCVLLMRWRKKIFSNFQNDMKYIEDYNSIKDIEGKPTIFPYSVLKGATNNFDPSTKLGEGGFGSVFKGVLPDGMEVAVKQLSAKSQQGNEEFLNEVTLITSVQHRNLVQLRGCCLKGEERLLVYEYLQNRSLYQALFNAPVECILDWRARMKILEGTARGLAYLHEGCHTRIVHRDIKASNILLDKDLNPKIADFGLARIFSENDTHVSTRVAGTAGYLAPEYAMRGQLTEKADVFSFGIVALELVSGRPNLDFHLQSYATYVLDWAWQLYEEMKLIHLLDPALAWCTDSIEESIRVTEMALLCTHSRATLRPTMTSVVSILTGGSQVVVPKLTRFDVRDYADLGFKVSDSDSAGLPSECTDNSNVSTLEPR